MKSPVQENFFLCKNQAVLAEAVRSHCSTLLPQLTCLAYHRVVVARIKDQPECVLGFQIKKKSHQSLYPSAPMASLHSTVSTPATY